MCSHWRLLVEFRWCFRCLFEISVNLKNNWSLTFGEVNGKLINCKIVFDILEGQKRQRWGFDGWRPNSSNTIRAKAEKTSSNCTTSTSSSKSSGSSKLQQEHKQQLKQQQATETGAAQTVQTTTQRGVGPEGRRWRREGSRGIRLFEALRPQDSTIWDGSSDGELLVRPNNGRHVASRSGDTVRDRSVYYGRFCEFCSFRDTG